MKRNRQDLISCGSLFVINIKYYYITLFNNTKVFFSIILLTTNGVFLSHMTDYLPQRAQNTVDWHRLPPDSYAAYHVCTLLKLRMRHLRRLRPPPMLHVCKSSMFHKLQISYSAIFHAAFFDITQIKSISNQTPAKFDMVR